jgi:hypothetical protein
MIKQKQRKNKNTRIRNELKFNIKLIKYLYNIYIIFI